MTQEVWGGLNAGTRGCSLVLPSPWQSSLLRFLQDQTVSISTTNEFLHFPSELEQTGICSFIESIIFFSPSDNTPSRVPCLNRTVAFEQRDHNYPKFSPEQPAYRYVNNKITSCLPSRGRVRKKNRKKKQQRKTLSWHYNVVFVGFLLLLSEDWRKEPVKPTVPDCADTVDFYHFQIWSITTKMEQTELTGSGSDVCCSHRGAGDYPTWLLVQIISFFIWYKYVFFTAARWWGG